jgi:hypothetical protein
MNSVLKLEKADLDVVKDCLKAAVDGPFFPEWEFQTLIGVDRDTVRSVYRAWPEKTVSSEDYGCAIIGSMNNLVGYPHGYDAEWGKYISASPDEVSELIVKLIDAGL